jgi:hypothetical protein
MVNPIFWAQVLLSGGNSLKNIIADRGLSKAGFIDGFGDAFFVSYLDVKRSNPGAFGQLRILEAAISLITFLEQFNGIGIPDTGNAFIDGKSQFEKIYESLPSAFPDDTKWHGEAANAYRLDNQNLRNLVHAMAHWDGRMADVLNTQAGQVNDARVYVAAMKDVLVALLWILTCVADPGFSMGVQVVFSLAAITAVSYELGQLVNQAADNADNVEFVIAKYNQVAEFAAEAAGAPVRVPGFTAEVAAVLTSNVSSFSRSSSMMSATPDMSELAGAASGDKRAPLGTVSGVGQTDATAPQTPASTMPTLAAMAGQATKAGRVPPVVPLATQGARAPAQQATPEMDTLAEGVQGAGAGAASGDQNAEGAPIQVATPGGEQAQQPKSAGRSR